MGTGQSGKSERDHKALEELKKDWRFESQSLYSPFTAGSGHAFPIETFTDAHYSQKDTSLNKALWGLWPVAPPDGYDKVLKHHETKRDELLPFKREQDPAKAGWFSIDKLKDALPHAERARIASNVRVIQELHTHLNAAGWLEFDTLADGLAPMHLLYTRQVMLDVPDLSSAIRSAKRLKNEGDILVARAQAQLKSSSDYADESILALFGAGIGKFCGALFALWPWTASGLIMTSEVAFGTGIAQIESQLWLDISQACFFLSGHAQRRSTRLSDGTRYSDTDGYYFVMLGRLANFVPVNMRYVPFQVLQQALHHVALYPLMFNTLADIWGPELMDAVLLSERCAAGAGVSPDKWAHADCHARHKGCMGVGFSKATRKQALAKLSKAKGEREAHMHALAEQAGQSRWEKLSDSDTESEDGRNEEKENKKDGQWSFDRKGRKTFGPKPEYTIGGVVHAV